MASHTRTILKLAGALALAVVAVAFVSSRVGKFRRSGETGLTVWFYDQAKQRLYEAPRDTIPPDNSTGKPGQEGVRAVVVAFRSDHNDPSKLRVAYLETCTPELKALLERAKAARAAGQPFSGHLPSHESAYFQTNSLVKAPSETDWHPSNSLEGRRIMTEWKSWRGPDGQPPVVCAP